MQNRVQKRPQFIDGTPAAFFKRARVDINDDEEKSDPVLVHVSYGPLYRIGARRSTLLTKTNSLEDFILVARRFFAIQGEKEAYLVVTQGALDGTEVSKDAWNTAYMRENAWSGEIGVEKYDLRVRVQSRPAIGGTVQAVQAVKDEEEKLHRKRPVKINAQLDTSDGRRVTCFTSGAGFPEVQIRIKRTTPMQQLVDAYCDRAGTDPHLTRFVIDGAQINRDWNIKQHGIDDWEDEVQIDVYPGVGGPCGHCRGSRV